MNNSLEFAYQLFYAHRDKMLETCKSESYTWRDSALVTLKFLVQQSFSPEQTLFYEEVKVHLEVIS